jgi:hypothetical protein
MSNYHIHTNNNYSILIFFHIVVSTYQRYIKHWRRDTSTYHLVYPIRRLSSYSTHTHNKQLEFWWPYTHMSPLHRFDRDHWSHMQVEKFIERIQFILFPLSFILNQTPLLIHICTPCAIKQIQMCSSIWRTQKLLDIYYIIYIYLLCLLTLFQALSNPIMMRSLHNSHN